MAGSLVRSLFTSSGLRQKKSLLSFFPLHHHSGISMHVLPLPNHCILLPGASLIFHCLFSTSAAFPLTWSITITQGNRTSNFEGFPIFLCEVNPTISSLKIEHLNNSLPGHPYIPTQFIFTFYREMEP